MLFPRETEAHLTAALHGHWTAAALHGHWTALHGHWTALATQQPVPTQPVTVEVQDLQGQLELKAARAEEERKQAVMRMILARMVKRTTAQALDRWVEVVEAARHSIKP